MLIKGGNGLDLHAVSTGLMQPDQFSEVITQLNGRFDAVHLREPSWRAEQSSAFFQWFLQEAFTIKLIVNKKTTGWELWKGTIHSPSDSTVERGGGMSIHSLGELSKAENEQAVYTVSGPVLPPFSAPKQVLPLHVQQHILSRASIPVIGIGGAERSTLKQFHERGYAGACFLSAVMLAPHPGEAAAEIRKERDRLCMI